jgi:streptomycin 6-kinase
MVTIPHQLAVNCRKTPDAAAWLTRLPETLSAVARRWSLTLLDPFDSDEVSCSWVAPVVRADGLHAVLKLGMPHMEAEHEAQGLAFWDGDSTVRLFDFDEDLGGIVMERCEPGTALRALPEPEQDLVIAGLLRRLWRAPIPPHPFRPLSDMLKHWSDETLADVDRWPDEGLVRDGLSLFDELSNTASLEVLLATDLHAGNVLESQREPWLVFDPKPFVGDPAYDAMQHLFNCDLRLRADPDGTVRRIADLLCVDHERVRLWTFARAAAEPRDDWKDNRLALARALSG